MGRLGERQPLPPLLLLLLPACRRPISVRQVHQRALHRRVGERRARPSRGEPDDALPQQLCNLLVLLSPPQGVHGCAHERMTPRERHVRTRRGIARQRRQRSGVPHAGRREGRVVLRRALLRRRLVVLFEPTAVEAVAVGARQLRRPSVRAQLCLLRGRGAGEDVHDAAHAQDAHARGAVHAARPVAPRRVQRRVHADRTDRRARDRGCAAAAGESRKKDTANPVCRCLARRLLLYIARAMCESSRCSIVFTHETLNYI